MLIGCVFADALGEDHLRRLRSGVSLRDIRQARCHEKAHSKHSKHGADDAEHRLIDLRRILSEEARGADALNVSAGIFCFTLSWLASAIGLAPIVGAYAAGLILEDLHYRDFAKEERHLEDLVRPISSFLVPVFFVLMGMRVDLSTFMRPEILGLAAVLTLAAVVGKQACALGALGSRLDWQSIGIGMIPRGEVGLIFASIGLTLVVRGERLIDAATYSAVVLMVMVTTLITPPALKWSLARGGKRELTTIN